MSLKHRLPELEASIDPAALRAATDEYSDLLLTLCLCMKMAGPTRANVRACATELKTPDNLAQPERTQCNSV